MPAVAHDPDSYLIDPGPDWPSLHDDRSDGRWIPEVERKDPVDLRVLKDAICYHLWRTCCHLLTGLKDELNVPCEVFATSREYFCRDQDCRGVAVVTSGVQHPVVYRTIVGGGRFLDR